MRKILLAAIAMLLISPAFAQESENNVNSQYQASIRDYLQQDVQNRQKAMTKKAEQILVSLPNDQKLYDESFVSIKTNLVEAVRDDGTPELNYVFDISYNCRHFEGVTDDYPSGSYLWDASNSCRAICNLTKIFVEGICNDIFTSGKEVTARITSTTDAAEIVHIDYNGEFGDFRYCPVTYNDEQIRISISQAEGLSNNAQLAYLRAQSVRNFLENNVRNLRSTDNTFYYITKSFSDVGSQYRRTSIELTVHDAFSETIHDMTADKIQDAYVDFNIPQREDAAYNNAYVLIIANEDYTLDALPSVPFASNDGAMMQQYFVKALGIPERQVKVLNNASRNEIKHKGIDWLKDNARAAADKGADGSVQGNADIYVYYAGHGIVNTSGAGFIIPNNINVDNIKSLNGEAKKGKVPVTNTYDIALGSRDAGKFLDQCISIDSLCRWFKDAPTRNITMIFDASFNGTTRNGSPMLRCELPKGTKLKKRKANIREDVIILLAADFTKTAYSFDDQHHGFLTYYLLKDIKSAAGEIDPITYQDLFESVERNVSKESALQGKLQEIEGITGGRYKDNWQNLRFR